MTQGHYARVNGLEMYYEVHGAGSPMVLLHGGLGAIGMYEHLLPALAATRQVIGVELQGHGHTADIARPMSFEQLGDDVAALILQLGLGQADLFGYSLGGGAALQAAIRHPEAVRKLVVVSTPYKSDGWYPEVRAGMKALGVEAARGMAGSPIHQTYLRIAPRPEDWETLVTKTGQMIAQEYDWSEGVAALKAHTMIVVADGDAIRPEHTVQFFKLLGGGQRDAGWDGSGRPDAQLAILPGLTHYDLYDTPALIAAVTLFLDAPRRRGNAPAARPDPSS